MMVGGLVSNKRTQFEKKQLQPNWGTIPPFARQDWRKPWKTSVKIVNAPVNFQPKHLPHQSLKHYHYLKFLEKGVGGEGGGQKQTWKPSMLVFRNMFQKRNQSSVNDCTCLNFNGPTGQCCPIKCTACSSERKNTVLQWALKLNSALAAAET